jgi:alkylhydroperoxidase family enzyme
MVVTDWFKRKLIQIPGVLQRPKFTANLTLSNEVLMNAEYKISLPPITDKAANGRVKEMLEATAAQVGFTPNMYRAMANSEGYLSAYLQGYNDFREGSGFSAQEQELIFLIISRANGCDYCTAANSMLADKVANIAPDVIAAIRAGETLVDTRLQTLANFTEKLLKHAD